LKTAHTKEPIKGDVNMEAKPISRRGFLKWTGISAVGFSLSYATAACMPVAPGAEVGKSPNASGAAAEKVVNSLGVELPPDAAPLDQQVWRTTAIEGKHFDTARNEYEGFAYEDTIETLTKRDGDGAYHPAAADSWETSQDGRTWTFHLRQGAKWSDGEPVTADDFVFSLVRYEDPKMANPYAWFLNNIENAEAFNKGQVKVEDYGVKKIDTYTFSITTTEPIPYFLDIVNWHYLVPKHMVEKNGDAWADSPATAVSNGPFIIKEWNRGKNVIYGLNPHYDGKWKPKLEGMEHTIIPQAGAPLLQMYQAGEIDTVYGLLGDQLAQVLQDPVLKKEVFSETSFVTAYLFFNDQKPPFNDLKVRQAISHAIDREAIAKDVMQGLDVAAYGHLPTGFPCSQNTDPEFRKIQGYDPALAKKLLAEAGFPDGKGFPEYELWTRQGQFVREAEAIQNMLKENLGIQVKPKDVERAFYMDKLSAHAIDFGLIPWGADFIDPSNFMDWWTTQGRHTWKNEDFNKLVNEARSLLDTQKRCQLYNQAEKILASDVGGVFVVYPVSGTAYKSYIGDIPINKNGVPGFTAFIPNSIYIKKH
jgi:ABC-type oligopeptide transport system substrate-binding subunit